MSATQIAPDWNRTEAVKLVDQLDILAGKLHANVPDGLRKSVLSARYAAWGALLAFDTKDAQK